MRVNVKFGGKPFVFDLNPTDSLASFSKRLVQHIDVGLSEQSMKLIGGGLKRSIIPSQAQHVTLADAGADLILAVVFGGDVPIHARARRTAHHVHYVYSSQQFELLEEFMGHRQRNNVFWVS